MKKLISILANILLLIGCGEDSVNWKGGLIGIWQPPGEPIGIMILHQGHDCFNGCRYDDSLEPIALYFTSNGLRVYGFEMPPDPHNDGPIEKYYQPVIDLLNELDKENNKLPIYMSGLSGGGWTASVITALDNRIIKGYSVEGDPAESDWEQSHTPYGYLTLYQMAGNRLTHIYRQSFFDCKDWTYPYPCVNDPIATDHYFSKWAADYILKDISQ